MRCRRPALLLAAVLLVSVGLSGCGDDGGDDIGDTTTTEADTAGTDDEAADTSAPEGDTATTEAPDDGSSTTEGGSTTSPNLPPNDSPLGELLLDPATVGPDYAPDDSLGDGSLDTDVCEEITLEPTWDDQAAQALLAGTGEGAPIFQQAILRFADDAAAEAFATELGDALVACQPGTEIEEIGGVGDAAVIATAPTGGTSSAEAGIVRVGDLVAWHLSVITATGPESPLDADLLAASAELLAG